MFNKVTRYLDPLNPLAFKKVFGSDAHKEILISFLNAVFHSEEENKIIDITFINPIQLPEIEARRQSLLDVLVRDQTGRKWIVQMLATSVGGFEERAQFYAAKTYCFKIKRAGEYSDVEKVIFLAITDYDVFPHKKGYKFDHVILDKKTEMYDFHVQDLKNFSFTFVELSKFNKTLDELKTVEGKWYYFLKHAEEYNQILEPLANNPEIRKAHEIVERFSWSESELQWYEKLMMDISDRKGIIAAAKQEGYEEGLQDVLKRKKLGKRFSTF